MLRESDILTRLNNCFDDEYCIYGDPAYGIHPYLLPPCRKLLSESQSLFNRNIISFWVAIDWGFAKINNLFKTIQYGKGMKLLLMPISNYYQISVLLSNIHTLLHNNQIRDYFNCYTMDLDEYLETQ